METKTNNNEVINTDVIGSGVKPQEQKNESFFGFMGNFFKNAGQKVIETSKDITKKVQDLDIGTKLKETGQKTIEIAKKSGQFVVEGTQKVYVRNIIAVIVILFNRERTETFAGFRIVFLFFFQRFF